MYQDGQVYVNKHSSEKLDGDWGVWLQATGACVSYHFWHAGHTDNARRKPVNVDTVLSQGMNREDYLTFTEYDGYAVIG